MSDLTQHALLPNRAGEAAHRLIHAEAARCSHVREKRELLLVAQGIESALSDDPTAAAWVKRICRVANRLSDD